MRPLKNFINLTFAFLFVVSVAQAKRFTNQYTEFELPAGWSCSLEGTEWVCQSENEARRKEAIIILAAKIRGSQDSLINIKTIKVSEELFTLPGGKTQVSEAKYAKVSKINGHQWIDALHLASEIPGFYTRYLATVKADLGVAVTFSVGKDHYAAYQSILITSWRLLRVFRQTNKNISQFVKKKRRTFLAMETLFLVEIVSSILDNRKKGQRWQWNG